MKTRFSTEKQVQLGSVGVFEMAAIRLQRLADDNVLAIAENSLYAMGSYVLVFLLFFFLIPVSTLQ